MRSYLTARSRRRTTARHTQARLRLEVLESRELLSGGSGLGPLVQVSSTSPFTNHSDLRGQSGTVYLNSEVEPRVAVDINNPMHMVGAYQQDRWSNGGCRGIVVATSFDGGNTWTRTAVPGCTVNASGVTLRASDPWVAFSPSGTVYVSYLTLNDPNVEKPHSVSVNKSTDGGLTWGPRYDLITNSDNNYYNDKDAITADPKRSNYAYAVWDRYDASRNTDPIYFARTSDSGQTWSTPAPIYDPGAGGSVTASQIVVLPDGLLVCMFVHVFSSGAEEIDVIRGSVQGAIWSAPSVVSPLRQVYEHDPDTGAAVRAGDIPDIAVNRYTGGLYIVFQTGMFSNFTHDDIALTYSEDAGQSWLPPAKFNQTPTNIPAADQQAFTPTLAVTGTGAVAVTYYDFRNNTPAPGALTDYWIAVTSEWDYNARNQPVETRLTNTSFNIEQAPNANGYFLGDYEGLTVMGTGFDSFGAFFTIANNASDPTSIYFRDPAGRPPRQGAPDLESRVNGGATPAAPTQPPAAESSPPQPDHTLYATALDLAFTPNGAAHAATDADGAVVRRETAWADDLAAWLRQTVLAGL